MFSANVKVTCFTSGPNVGRQTPTCHVQMIIWIFPESLRSPSPSLFSLLKVPVRDSASPKPKIDWTL